MIPCHSTRDTIKGLCTTLEEYNILFDYLFIEQLIKDPTKIGNNSNEYVKNIYPYILINILQYKHGAKLYAELAHKFDIAFETLNDETANEIKNFIIKLRMELGLDFVEQFLIYKWFCDILVNYSQTTNILYDNIADNKMIYALDYVNYNIEQIVKKISDEMLHFSSLYAADYISGALCAREYYDSLFVSKYGLHLKDVAGIIFAPYVKLLKCSPTITGRIINWLIKTNIADFPKDSIRFMYTYLLYYIISTAGNYDIVYISKFLNVFSDSLYHAIHLGNNIPKLSRNVYKLYRSKISDKVLAETFQRIYYRDKKYKYILNIRRRMRNIWINKVDSFVKLK